MSLNLIETEFTGGEHTEQALADWTVRELPGAQDAITWAARRITNEFEDLVEFDDMVQDAEILLAFQGSSTRKLYETEARPGAILQHRLYRDLFDKLKRPAHHLRKNQSYEAALEKFEPGVS